MPNAPSMSARLMPHLRRFRTGEWDRAVLRRTKLCLFDSLGCFSAGRGAPHMDPVAKVAYNLFGATPAAPSSTMSPFLMAYLYGQAANALDYDDTLLGHPGGPIIGAVLATAASKRLSVDRLLRGIAAGYEASAILAGAAAPSPEQAALVRSVGVWDTAAAGIGCCIALGLDDDVTERVIGVALSHSLLPFTAKWYVRPVPALKNNMGWIAAGAVMSTELALAGLAGVTEPLEGETGMWRMVGSDRWVVNDQLFDKPAVLRVGFKYFPACWHLQQHLKAFASLLPSIPSGDDVAQIVVESPPEYEKFCPTEISGTADIAFSLPATFGLLLAGVEPGPQWDLYDASGARPDFRYQRSERRSIRVRTRGGAEFAVDVEASDMRNLAAWGLDDDGVMKKHERLTDPSLHAETTAALHLDHGTELDRVPDCFYAAVTRLMHEARRVQ